MESMKKLVMALGLVAVVALAVFAFKHFKAKEEVAVQGFNGIGIGGGNFALGFGQTDNGRPVVGIPWGKGDSNNDDMD